MKREFTKLMAALMLLLFIAPLGMWGQSRDTWTRVTSTNELLAGGTFIIGYEATANSGVIVPMRNEGTATTSAAGYMYSGTTSGSSTGGTINMASVTNTTPYEVTIVASTKVSGAICIKIGNNFLGNTNTKNNCKLFTSEANTTAFTPTMKTNDAVELKITANATYTHFQYNSNSGTTRYAVYSGTQKDPVIYKKSSEVIPTHAYTLNVMGDDEGAEASLYVNGEELGANDEIAEGETVTVSVSPSDGYAYSVSVKDANNVAVEYDDEMDSFTMPTSDVIITVTTTLIPTYIVTFNTNGGTFVGNEDFPQQSNTKEAGNYTLPSATKEGFTFGGWLATGSANAVTGSYEVTGNVDFTAQWIQGFVDVLNLDFTGITGTAYAEWSDKEGTSGAVYAGQSGGDNDAIQLRSKNNNSGIVTTTSGGTVKKVTVIWESHTQSGRTLNVYGSNTAYTDATNLYDEDTDGDLLGTIVYGTSTELVISGDYAYIGLRSDEGAMYLTEIDITWGSASAVAAPTFEPGTGTTFHGSQMVTITAEEGADIRYTTDGTEPTATTGTVYTGPFSIDATTAVKAVAYATIEGETETSAVAEAIYTRLYNITLTQPFHGSISCDAEAAAGTQVTVTATPDVNYQFGTLTVTPTATVSNNTFTMPAADVNVTATFVASNTYTVSFSINGKIEMTATTTGSFNVDNFVAEVATEGMRFKGWYDNDTRVSGDYNPETDKTLVAVFEDASSAYTLVTSTDQLVAGNLIVITAQNTSKYALSTQGDNSRNAVEGVEKASDYSSITINSQQVCELTLGKVVDGNNTYWTFYDPDYNDETGTGGYLYTASTSSNWLRTQHANDANGEWTVSFTSGGFATITSHGGSTHNYLKYNTNSHIFSSYLSTSGNTQPVFLYTKSASKAMRDVEVEATSVVAEVAADVVVTVKADGIVYLTGNNAGNSANLVVEDGGQLVTSANVAGTMQKNVTGYGSTTAASNYYLITAPSTINPQNVEDMLNTNGYDLYYFDQSAEDEVDGENVLLEWRNYNAEGSDHYHFNLEAGTGYLYANKENKTLNLAGTLAKNDNNETFAQNITYVEGYRFSGWNLVGNPFPSNASVSLPFYKMNSNGDGINNIAMLANSVIAPMEGVFVIASVATTQVTFAATTDAVTTNAKKSVNIDVKRDNELMDRAIVSFNGSTLSKLNLNENATKVYFQ